MGERDLPEADEDDDGVDEGEREGALAHLHEGEFEGGGIALAAEVPGVADGDEVEGNGKYGLLAHECDDGSGEEEDADGDGGAAGGEGEGWVGFAQGGHGVEPGVDGEDSAGSLGGEERPEEPGPGRKATGGGEGGDEGGGGEGEGAGDLEERVALAVAEVNPEGEGEEGCGGGEDDGVGEPGAGEEQGKGRSAGDEGFDKEPESGGTELWRPVAKGEAFPLDASAAEGDEGLLDGVGAGDGEEAGNFLPAEGAGEDGGGDKGGEEHGGGAVFAREEGGSGPLLLHGERLFEQGWRGTPPKDGVALKAPGADPVGEGQPGGGLAEGDAGEVDDKDDYGADESGAVEAAGGGEVPEDEGEREEERDEG